MSSPLLTGANRRQEIWAGPVIDADVHAVVPDPAALMPYLAPRWQEFSRERQYGGSGLQRDYIYPPNAASTARDEWRPTDGSLPASSLDFLKRDVLDPWDVDFAVVNCYQAVDWVRGPDLAAGFASAINDWLIAEWLDRDPRLRASIVVPTGLPETMLAEIQRVGDHPGFVQVFMPVRSNRPYGNRVWHPVYKAMAERNLVMGMHFGGTNDAAPTPTGWPAWYVEEYAGEQQLFMSQILSMIAEGVFAMEPRLMVSVQEIGFAWLPSYWWRLDSKWKGLRRDIPWVTEPPSAVIRKHMRFTTAPFDGGPPAEMAKILEWLGSDEMLMYASDYPHRHDEDIASLLSVVEEPSRAGLMAENARALYGL